MHRGLVSHEPLDFPPATIFNSELWVCRNNDTVDNVHAGPHRSCRHPQSSLLHRSRHLPPHVLLLRVRGNRRVRRRQLLHEGRPEGLHGRLRYRGEHADKNKQLGCRCQTVLHCSTKLILLTTFVREIFLRVCHSDAQVL